MAGTTASAGRGGGTPGALGCSHISKPGSRGSCPVHTYPPGQVQIEIPGAQEAQQEGVCERVWGLRDARLFRSAPQFPQTGLYQRRVVGERVELWPGHWPRPHLCHARRATAAARATGKSVGPAPPSAPRRGRRPTHTHPGSPGLSHPAGARDTAPS